MVVQTPEFSVAEAVTDKASLPRQPGPAQWELGSQANLYKSQDAAALPDDAQLRKEREIFAQSLPIDGLAAYKDALSSGDPQKMAKFEGSLSPHQAELLREIRNREATSPLGMVKGLTNLAFMTGSIELAANGASGFNAFMHHLLGRGNDLLTQSSVVGPAAHTPAGPILETQLKLGVAMPAPGLTPLKL